MILKKIVPVLLACLVTVFSCSSDTGINSTPPIDNGGNESDEPLFQPIEETIPEGNQDPGFFLNNWEPKKITAPDYKEHAKPEKPLDARIQINTELVITKVSPTIYGTNANPYNGQMGNKSVLIDYLKDLDPHLIRFPGGNLSNVYFWDRKPGNYPDDAPPPNTLLKADGSLRTDGGYWYGKNKANWTMSLDNYYKLLKKTNSEGVITVNFAYARYGLSENPIAVAAGYAADWVRYDNGRTTYWEIGNENYGSWQTGYRINTSRNKDGQPEFISGKLYGKIAKVFIDSMRAAAQEIGVEIKIGTQLIEREITESWESEIVRNWNEQYFEAAGNIADYYIVHNYYTPYQEDSSPSVILESASEVTANMMQWMRETTKANGVELKPIALTEWNIFATGSKQMVSNISGVHAALVLGELIKYEYGMAQRWDIANAWNNGNDHGMFNSARDNQQAPDAPDWNPRPSFYYMYYFQKYFGDRMVWSGTQGDQALKSYASTFSSGQIGVVVANMASTQKTFDIQLRNAEPGSRYYWYVLEGGDDKPFSLKVLINGQGPDGRAGGPSNYDSIEAYAALTGGEAGIKLTAPPYSVTYILIEGN